jgi:hypothetical protein
MSEGRKYDRARLLASSCREERLQQRGRSSNRNLTHAGGTASVATNVFTHGWYRAGTLILIALLGLCGCVRKQVIPLDDYASIVRGAEPPEAAVALRVEDARQLPPDRGASDIGIIHEEFGSKIVVQAGDPAAIPYLVGAATKDALRLARVGVAPQAPRTLVVTVHKFWATVPSAEERVVVGLQLQDGEGTSLLNTSVLGGAGGLIWTESNLNGVFQRALADYAERATKVFVSSDFQRQLY